MAADIEKVILIGLGPGNAADLVAHLEDDRPHLEREALMGGREPGGSAADDDYRRIGAQIIFLF
jgi:hypothetical protein